MAFDLLKLLLAFVKLYEVTFNLIVPNLFQYLLLRGNLGFLCLLFLLTLGLFTFDLKGSQLFMLLEQPHFLLWYDLFIALILVFVISALFIRFLRFRLTAAAHFNLYFLLLLGNVEIFEQSEIHSINQGIIDYVRDRPSKHLDTFLNLLHNQSITLNLRGGSGI